MDFHPQIERILNKLSRVREENKPSFGSVKHQFRLAEPVSEETIRLFENQHGIRLPEDYRQFLMLAGGSGAGPYYGILPLDKWDAASAGRNSLPTDYLVRPCPLVPGAKPMLPPGAGNEFGIEPRDQFLQGSIALVEQGCAYYAMLIVSGPARGRVAYISIDDPEMAYFPENPSFLSWYERWLDELLADYDISWFGFGALGTEEQLALRLKDQAVSAEDKSEAIRTLIRIKKLTPATMEILSAYSRETSEAPAPRATAANLWISRASSDDGAFVQQLLEDSSPEVRKEVLLALMRKKSPMLTDALRQLINDRDPEVAVKALLHGKGKLTRKEIEPFLKAENVDLRRNAIYAMGGAPDARVEELIALALRDEDTDCRINAAHALRDLKDPAVVRQLEELLKRETNEQIRANIMRALEGIDNRGPKILGRRR
jgi:hypothetical protein